MTNRSLSGFCGLLVALTLLAASSRAEANPGVRLGVTDDPESLFGGFFYEAPLASAGSGFFAIEPGLDLGIGDEFFSLRGTVNGKYLIPVGSVFLYPILGLSVYYINVDCPGDDCDDASAGLNLGLGARVERFNFELTAGIDDLPDITFSVGFLL